MPVDVIMPALGMAQDTGTLLRWLKAEGDRVVAGEALMEIETDKTTVEIEAPATGTLGALRAQAGDDVPIGVVMASILAEGERPEPAEPSPRRPLASPKARRLARAAGIDLGALAGTGPYGAVRASDVEAVSRDDRPAGELEIAPTSIWLRMASRMSESWGGTPHVFLLREVDASRLRAWRLELERRDGGTGVTYSDLLARLCADALTRHPRMNATWSDGTIVELADVNLGLAVATDEHLVVPVLRRASTLGVREIAARRAALVQAARNGTLRPDDVAGATFTISNLGMFGVDAFTAIVNPPQAAILAVGRIADRVVAVDGQPVVRPMLWLSLSFDHRVADGARGARFLDDLASLVESPEALVS